jgi:erythrocyte band 7 integral membrane protein
MSRNLEEGTLHRSRKVLPEYEQVATNDGGVEIPLHTFTRPLNGGERFLIALSVLFTILTFPLTLFFVVKTVPQGFAGIVQRFGRWKGVVHLPGVVYVIPFIDTLDVVDMRVHTYDMPCQQMLSKDTVSINVDAVIYYQITDLMSARFAVDDVHLSTRRLAQTALRDVVGSALLQDITSNRRELNRDIQEHLIPITSTWGVRITHVEIKDILLPDDLKRVMAAKAEAVREAEAKVVSAQGEKAASFLLREAAEEIAKSPAAMQLRYLQTLTSIASQKTNTIIFPVPMDGASSGGSAVLQQGLLSAAVKK